MNINTECKDGEKVVWAGMVPCDTYGETLCRIVLKDTRYFAEQYNGGDKVRLNPFSKKTVSLKYPWSRIDDVLMRAEVFEYVFSIFYESYED